MTAACAQLACYVSVDALMEDSIDSDPTTQQSANSFAPDLSMQDEFDILVLKSSVCPFCKEAIASAS